MYRRVLHACELLACLVLLHLMHALDLYNERLGHGRLVILFKVDARVVECPSASIEQE
jgi:hypothetical protein